MTDRPSVPSDAALFRRALRRWSTAALALFLLLSAAWALAGFYGRLLFRDTGEAAWLWSHHRLAADAPEAFFLTRTFDLPPGMPYLHIRIAGDPEYTLWVNGREVGGARYGKAVLHRYDITHLMTTGRNRIVIAVRAPRGAGGVLAALDAGPMKKNWIVTDQTWRLYPTWSPSLLLADPRGLAWERPRLLGRPPFGRWNYPGEIEGPAYPARVVVKTPRAVESFDSWLPVIEFKSGIAVAGRVPAKATAFDFGPVAGRGAISVAAGKERAVSVRYANQPGELRAEGVIESFVVGEGETEVVDPEARSFRYLVVYDEPAQAWVRVEAPPLPPPPA